MSPATARRLRQGLEGLVLGSAAALYLAFALPVSLWIGNRAEFTAPWTTLLGPFMAPAALVVLGCGLLAALSTPAMHARGRVLFAAALLMAWVQGTLLVWDYGLFDGSGIDWSVGAWRGLVDASLWIGVPLAAYLGRNRFGEVVVRAAVALCLVQAVLSGSSLVGADRSAVEDGAAAQAVLADFSPDNNVLHLIADGFQTDTFADLLAEPGGADRARALDGFVLFRDNLGVFPSTHLAVPALVGGQVYENAEPLPAFIDRAMGADNILGAARKSGYEVEIGAPTGGVQPIYRKATDARVLGIASTRHDGAMRAARNESLLLADLVLFRIAPHLAKRSVYNDQRWFLQWRYGQRLPGQDFIGHNAFLREMAARMTAHRPRPTYKVIHLMLSHLPLVARRDCSTSAWPLEVERENVRNQQRCSLANVLGLLQAMRRLGIYDSATIMVSGDHGSFMPPDSLGGEKAQGQAPVWVGQARPVMLVKAPGAHGPLRVSDAPTWIIDTGATIADAAAIPGRFPGTSALRLAPGAARQRRFLIYEYHGAEWDADYVREIREFIVEGPGDQLSSWRQGRTLRPREAAPAAAR